MNGIERGEGVGSGFVLRNFRRVSGESRINSRCDRITGGLATRRGVLVVVLRGGEGWRMVRESMMRGGSGAMDDGFGRKGERNGGPGSESKRVGERAPSEADLTPDLTGSTALPDFEVDPTLIDDSLLTRSIVEGEIGAALKLIRC